MRSSQPARFKGPSGTLCPELEDIAREERESVPRTEGTLLNLLKGNYGSKYFILSPLGLDLGLGCFENN